MPKPAGRDGARGTEAPPPDQALRRVVQRAAELGFDAVAIARADEPLDEDYAHYEAFVDAGYAGEMRYLVENREARRRLDTDSILPGARSVICVARSYRRDRDAEASDGEALRHVARYARGLDYHGFVRRSVRKLAAFVRRLGDGVRARPMIDDAPLLERAWARRSGLGFIGKNGLLIAPGKGSFLLLGEVVTTLDLPAGQPMESRCGTCRSCLDACPTDAFVRPFVLDARRCISYLTIEARAYAPAESPDLAQQTGSWLFGCDACQSICPYNATLRHRPERRPDAFGAHPELRELDLMAIAQLSEAEFEVRVRRTPLRRPGWAQLVRNAIVSLTNQRDPRVFALAEHFRTAHPSLLVRQTAEWALRELAPSIDRLDR